MSYHRVDREADVEAATRSSGAAASTVARQSPAHAPEDVGETSMYSIKLQKIGNVS